jgi:hypothetical protein
MQAQLSKPKPPFSTSIDEGSEPWNIEPPSQAPKQQLQQPHHQKPRQLQQKQPPMSSAQEKPISELPVGGGFNEQDLMTEDQGPSGPMVQCPSCSRKFNELAYTKHSKVGSRMCMYR